MAINAWAMASLFDLVMDYRLALVLAISNTVASSDRAGG